MANLPLTSLCGENATQTAEKFEMYKEDFAEVGLNCPPGSNIPTPKSNNSPTSLMMSMCLFGSKNFTRAAQEANPDINMTIEQSPYAGTDFANNQNYETITFNITFRKPKPSTTIDPDDYDS